MKNKFRKTADRGATSNLSVMLSVPTVTKGSRVMTYVAPVWLGKICLILSLVLFFTLSPTPQQGFCFSGRGEVYSDEQVIKAIISEAIGEPKEGIVAVAYVFKKRIDMKEPLGSCGYKRKDIDEFIAEQPKRKVELVKEIWACVKAEKISNPTPNAFYFENVEAYGKPDWCRVLIKKIGNHSFYEKNKNRGWLMLSKKQLEERKKYIGASEAAAVLGLSRYATPLEIWAIKTGQIEAPQEETLPMWVGTEMEEIIAKRFTLETGKKVQRVNSTIYHKQHPFLACHLDRKVVGENSILQCKTASAYKCREWENDIPVEYIIQEYHELACSGYKKAYIACLIGNHKFVITEILFDKEKLNILNTIKKEVAFWNKFVAPKVMPDTITASDSDVLYQLYPKVIDGSEVQLDDNATKIIESLDALEGDYKSLALQIDAQKNELKAILKENEVGTTKNHKVSWKPQITKRLDTHSLKEENPGIYEKYSKTTESRVLRITVKKGEK